MKMELKEKLEGYSFQRGENILKEYGYQKYKILEEQIENKFFRDIYYKNSQNDLFSFVQVYKIIDQENKESLGNGVWTYIDPKEKHFEILKNKLDL